MTIDPFSPRNLAAAFAVGGLITMMLAPEPSWHSAGIGLACLLAFGGLSLLPAPRAGAVGPETAPRRNGRHRMAEGDAHGAPAPADASPTPPWPPAPRGLNDPHPALFKGLRTRRGGSSP